MSPAHRTPDLPRAAVESLLLDTTPWLSCDDCFERLDTYAEAVVSDPAHEDPAMRAHLLGCPACAEEGAALVALLARPVGPRDQPAQGPVPPIDSTA